MVATGWSSENLPCSASLATIVEATPFDTDAQRNTVSRRDLLARPGERFAIADEEGDAAPLDDPDRHADHVGFSTIRFKRASSAA